MATKELLQGLEAGWQEATVGHKFIKACVDGSIRPEQFNTWLAQVRKLNCVVAAAGPALNGGLGWFGVRGSNPEALQRTYHSATKPHQ